MDDSESCSSGTGDRQLHHNNVPARASHLVQNFFCKTANRPGHSATLQPRSVTLQLLTLPKTKITFEREETDDEFQEKYNGAADGDWENCVRSQGAYFGGD